MNDNLLDLISSFLDFAGNFLSLTIKIITIVALTFLFLEAKKLHKEMQGHSSQDIIKIIKILLIFSIIFCCGDLALDILKSCISKSFEFDYFGFGALGVLPFILVIVGLKKEKEAIENQANNNSML